jgi:hypothetical protein
MSSLFQLFESLKRNILINTRKSIKENLSKINIHLH